ncbi:hypothetical protein [Roseibacillus persicicus]|nr:hypothetical protein [Roseibacillus persicicus]
MMIFRPLFLFLTASAASAEIITLKSDDRFHGELLQISPEEGLVIQSPRSPEPIHFRADSFSHLDLENTAEIDPTQTERLVLTNGDILPGRLTSLDEEQLRYKGLAGGDITVPRKLVSTLRFGIKPQALSYEGPAPLEKWTGSGVNNWVLSEDTADGLLMLEPGEMQQDVGLGKQFILQFDLKWQERPSIRLYFCDDLSDKAEKDRYYIDINSGGIQIRRESLEPRWHTLLSLSQIESFDDNQISVELRVNRLVGSIELFLDGKLIRIMRDTAKPTQGDGLVIVRSRSDNSASYLSNLKAYTWDAVSQLELLEEPASEDVDSLVNAEGERMSGALLGLEREEPAPQAPVEESENLQEEPTAKEAPEDEEPVEENKKAATEEAKNETTSEDQAAEEDSTPESPAEEAAPSPQVATTQERPSFFLLKSPFADELKKIPANDARIIYFSQSGEASQENVFPKYELDLTNDGLVSARSITLNGDQLMLEHHLLGSITVPRSAVKAIRYLNELSNDDE